MNKESLEGSKTTLKRCKSRRGARPQNLALHGVAGRAVALAFCMDRAGEVLEAKEAAARPWVSLKQCGWTSLCWMTRLCHEKIHIELEVWLQLWRVSCDCECAFNFQFEIIWLQHDLITLVCVLCINKKVLKALLRHDLLRDGNWLICFINYERVRR